MKKIYFLGLLGVLLIFSTCKTNDFDTNAEYREIAVIYGLLDIGTTKQYIKVSKGFQNTNTNAVELAADDPEITQFQDSLEVTLHEYNGAGTWIQSQPMTKEFLALKDQGTFNQENNYWYTIDTSLMTLKGGYEYEVQAKNIVTGNIHSGSAKMIDDFCIVRPTASFNCDDFDLPAITFYTVKGYRKIAVEFETALNAEVYKVYVDFNYAEFTDNDTSTTVRKTYRFPIQSSIMRPYDSKGVVELQLNSEAFFTSFMNQLDTALQVESMKRYPENLTFTIVASGPEMAEYISAENAYSAITQTKPFYTNITDQDGNEGAGLMTSRYFKSKRCVVSTRTLEDIRAHFPGIRF